MRLNTLRKWNRVLHRDIGYLAVGMSVIYGLSGIALNHTDGWNPNYTITRKEIKINTPIVKETLNKEKVLNILENYGEEDNYKKYYFPEKNILKIFIKGGTVRINTDTGTGNIEKLKRRPVLYQVNFLHYNNPRKLWTWFSDIYAAALILLAISGLFILRGKKGITGRGAWLTAIGIIIPGIFLLIYF